MPDYLPIVDRVPGMLDVWDADGIWLTALELFRLIVRCCRRLKGALPAHVRVNNN